jgi:hypothetical protein
MLLSLIYRQEVRAGTFSRGCCFEIALVAFSGSLPMVMGYVQVSISELLGDAQALVS